MNSVEPPTWITKFRLNFIYSLRTFTITYFCVSVSLTHSSPCQPHNHSRWGDIVHSIHCENRFAHIVLQVVRCNSHCALLTADYTESHLTENLKVTGKLCFCVTEVEQSPSAGLQMNSADFKNRALHYFTFSTCFCRFLTPDSLQYCLMSRLRASGEIEAFSSVRPQRVRS